MEFFNKIYNSDYFIIGLFVVIAILLVIFVLLIISGKKEKDKQNQEEMDEVSKNLETIDTVKMLASNNNNSKEEEISSSTIKEEQSEEKVINDNIDENSTEENNEELFNTSIFHGLPQELIQEEKKEDSSIIPDSLFEPLPNLEIDKKIDTPEEKEDNSFVLPTFETPSFEMPKMNNQKDNIKPIIPDLPKVDMSVKQESDLTKEDILPKVEPPKVNQFSSVYVSKIAKPVKEEIKDTDQTKPLAYDPSLFTSYVKKEEPIDLDKTITNMPIPEIAAVPPMGSVNDIKEEKTINRNNSFDFELPTLASLDSKDEKKEENSFPTFNTETYNINK